MRIPLVEARDQRADDVVQMIITEFNRHYPNQKGVDNFVILSNKASDNRLSLRLEDVPLGVALDSVAHGLGLRVFIKDSKIALIDARLIEETDTVLQLSPEVLEGLGIKRPITAEALADAIRKWKIFVDLDVNIQFDPKQEYAKIHMAYAESIKLHAILDLFKRGLRRHQ